MSGDPVAVGHPPALHGCPQRGVQAPQGVGAPQLLLGFGHPSITADFTFSWRPVSFSADQAGCGLTM